MSELGDLADDVARIEQSVSDAIYDAIRAQLHAADATDAAALERQLAKIRRALQKAEALLRSTAVR